MYTMHEALARERMPDASRNAADHSAYRELDHYAAQHQADRELDRKAARHRAHRELAAARRWRRLSAMAHSAERRHQHAAESAAAAARNWD